MNYYPVMTTKRLLVLKNLSLVIALGWTVFIGYLCLANFKKLPNFGVSQMDKYVHFTFHFIFTITWGTYSWLQEKKLLLAKIKQIVIASILYGILIEILQGGFTATRTADIFDVFANTTGATIGYLVFIILQKNKISFQ